PAGVTVDRPSAALDRHFATLPPHAARLHPGRGLLLEPAATNHVAQSTDLAAAPWSGNLATLTGGIAGAPDGSDGAHEVALANAGARWRTPIAATGDAFTFS